jgi:cysteinyl-tRNA synthetase
VEEIVGVLGLDDADAAPSRESSLTDEEIHALVVERDEARSRRDFEVADEIRDRLVAAGVSIEDGPNGTRWVRR